MAYTTPRTWVTDETITATLLNTHVRDNVAWLATDAPACRVYNNAAISHTTSGTPQALTFNSERYDVGGSHSTSSNTGRLTVPSGGGGVYYIFASIEFASNATGYRQVDIRLNGTSAILSQMTPAINGTVTRLNVGGHYQLSAGDYVEVVVNQTSGGALNVQSSSPLSPEFGWAWVRT